MDSAKSILRNIVSATEHIQNATARYSTTKGVRKVRQYSLVRLEFELQTIADASRAILSVFDDPLLRRHYMLDDRFIDWLSGSEPEMCLDTLNKMVKLLTVEHDVQVFSGLTPTHSGSQEDDMNRAIAFFNTRKACLHFLLTTDIWNCEKEVPRQVVPSKAEVIHMHGQRESTTSAKDIVTEQQRVENVSQKLKKLVKVLDPLNCSRKHQETSLIRQSDTCMWLPATDTYRSWREGKYPFLWLQGKAGAGKSVLASSVINDLNDTKKDGELLVYFYCDFRNGRSTSAIEVMRSLLAELTERLCEVMMDPEDLLDELLKVAINVVDPFYNVKGLSHYLCKVARLYPRKPFVVVDALDECKEVESLLDGLIMSSGDVRMFATTRPLQNIIKILADFPCMSLDKMADELSADILLHVTRELDSRNRLRTFDGRLREEIRSTLCAKADGMFRWVQCQIDTLDRCTSVSEIRKALESLPGGLEETYRRILIRIDKRWEYSRLVRRGLVWLVTALRPMRLRELLEAVTIDPALRALDPGFLLIQDVDFLEVSRSLVIHDKMTDIVTLSHMSVKDYLVGELIQEKLPEYHIVLEDAHERSARLCMAYIAFCLDEMKECGDKSASVARERGVTLSTSYASRPFLNYVLSFGFSHLAHLGPGNEGIFMDMETLQKEICRYLREWDRMCKLVPSIRSGIPWASSEHDFTMYTLIGFGSDALFHAFLGQSSTLVPREGTNPLVYAAHFGKTEHARALILRGVSVNQPGLVVNKLAVDEDMYVDESDEDDTDSDVSITGFPNEREVMPIQVAVEHWHTEMLDLMLAEGSNIPDELLSRVLKVQPHQFPPYIIRRLLQTAEFVKWAVFPWDNQRLLEAFVEDEEDYGQKEGGDELEVATRRLVQVGCAEALLLVALEKGCIPVIKSLLSVDEPFPLNIPSGSRTHAIAKALAANGDTPLHVTMRLSDENHCLIITRLLIEAGCDPLELDADDRPPIHVAVGRGFVSVVEYLLSLYVPLPRRILFAAAQTTLVRRVGMIRLLVDNGADVHLYNPSGDGLLHVTMRSLDRSVCLEIAEILIGAGCNPLACNLLGETPLQIAAKQGYHEVVNYLILFSSSSDISSLLHKNNTATQVAVLRSLIGNVDCLYVQQEEEDRLFKAIRQFLDDENECLEATKTFIGVEGELFVRSSGSGMLFDIAVRRGFFKVVEYLTSQSVPSPPTILFTAVLYRVSMVSSLIKNGADVHTLGDNGDTLLHVSMQALTAEGECCRTTQLFIEAGCDPFIPNTAKQRPIDIAASRGFFFVVEYLVSHALKVKVRCVSGSDSLLDAIRNRKEYSIQRMQSTFGGDHNTFLLGAEGEKALLLSVMRGLPSVVDYLLARDVPLPSDILATALEPLILQHEYDAEKFISVISSLVRKGANPHTRDSKQNTLLHHVMQIKSKDYCLQVTKILIAAGCSPSIPNAKGELPIRAAVVGQLFSIAEILLSPSVPLPSDIFLHATQPSNFTKEDSDQWLSMIRSFVREGANVHARDSKQNTVLHRVMSTKPEHHILDAIKVFMEAGCNPSARNVDGILPIKIAATGRFLTVVQFLLSCGALFPPDILFAVLRSQGRISKEVLDMVSLFIEHGVDVCATLPSGDSALHVALAHEFNYDARWFMDVVDVLVQAGCDTHARNGKGRTPVEVAAAMGHPWEVVEYLQHICTVPRQQPERAWKSPSLLLSFSPPSGTNLRRVFSNLLPSFFASDTPDSMDRSNSSAGSYRV